MYSRFLAIAVMALLAACSQSESGSAPESGSLSLGQYEALEGFLDLYWDADGGRLLIKVCSQGRLHRVDITLKNTGGSQRRHMFERRLNRFQ